MQFHTHTLDIPYNDALHYYKRIKTKDANFVFESTDAADKSSRLSLIGLDSILELKGKKETCHINLLDERGRIFFDFLQEKFPEFVTQQNNGNLTLEIPKTPFIGAERERFNRQNIAQVIRQLLIEFQLNDKNFFGLYGALSYNFIYLYEEIDQFKENDTADFHLFLFDNILFFNHLTQQANIYSIRQEAKEAENNAKKIKETLIKANSNTYKYPNINIIDISPTDDIFKNQVSHARQLCKEGELMEVVFCRKISALLEGDTLPIYESYRKLNPSPYMFHFDFGDEVLLGTSPEVMVRYENGKVILRPISGSIARGESVIEDHHNMMQLLNDPKEKSELDMLIDLGRNDLSKVCKAGVEIEHYRVIEKYSSVIHTVAQVAGELEEGYLGFDALIAALNAGTLTGAPKVRAMQEIENTETHTRGYYGGCIGYFLFNGEVNTGITIRTAHIKNSLLTYCSGATLLYESDPEKELIETNFKAAAFMKNIEKFTGKAEVGAS